ncbi:hypothetical protein K491DRAFT_699389 [Lophiostoma macrostomum CBS 122681]|uniref:Uncharacterized protein n=1 Tax=Lophiostoma macrostomum CBS 122681 TaxID=1314788 RepID=A0A6A6SMG5_9PLEO|nr:hypothetical protein K491DRAFT_699389 [Lophiostoma macrostomum CBS 122681]
MIYSSYFDITPIASSCICLQSSPPPFSSLLKPNTQTLISSISILTTTMGCSSSKYHESYKGRHRSGKSYDRTGAYFARAGDGGGWVGDTVPVSGGARSTGGGAGGGDGGGGDGGGC